MDLMDIFLMTVAFITGLFIGRITAPKPPRNLSGNQSWPSPQSPLSLSTRAPKPSAFEPTESIQELIKSGQKLLAIKQYREIKGCSLKEAKEYIDQQVAQLKRNP